MSPQCHPERSERSGAAPLPGLIILSARVLSWGRKGGCYEFIYGPVQTLIILVAILGFIMGMTTVVLGIAIVGAVIIGVSGLVVLRKFFA